MKITSHEGAQIRVTEEATGEIQSYTIKPEGWVDVEISNLDQIKDVWTIEQKSVHVVSDHDITVYAVSHRPTSTDSYIAIPTTSLGTQYYVAGYAPLLENGKDLNGKYEDFYTEAAIVGTEENTIVHFTLPPSAHGKRSPSWQKAVRLNKGQTFMLAAEGRDGACKDITGALVSSDKPIAFVTGHRCAQIPSGVSYCDVLLEMEAPVSSWGSDFVATKFERKESYAIRVIASMDSTTVALDGTPVAHLQNGEFYENNDMKSDATIHTSSPSLVEQLSTSSSADSVLTGDPFMLFLIPNDRFVHDASVITMVNGEFYHYVNVVVPDDGVESLRISGHKVLARFVKKIAGANLNVIHYEITYGAQSVHCDKPVAVYCYGFGTDRSNFDSYGHACGQRLGK